MTNKQKKNFVDFLQSKSAFYIYMKTYRERHLSINPDNMQDFLRDTEPQLAIIGAFVYPKHELSVYNRDFWLKINEEWLRHLENNKQEEETHSLLVDVDFIDVEKRIRALSCFVYAQCGGGLEGFLPESEQVAGHRG